MLKMVPYEVLEEAGYPGIITVADVKKACAAVTKISGRPSHAVAGPEFSEFKREWILYFGKLGE